MSFYVLTETCHDCASELAVTFETADMPPSKVEVECPKCGVLNGWRVDFIPSLMRVECGKHGPVR
jgi:hypothetical protein